VGVSAAEATTVLPVGAGVGSAARASRAARLSTSSTARKQVLRMGGFFIYIM